MSFQFCFCPETTKTRVPDRRAPFSPPPPRVQGILKPPPRPPPPSSSDFPTVRVCATGASGNMRRNKIVCCDGGFLANGRLANSRAHSTLHFRTGTARAQRGHSANHYAAYPGNTPANHPPTEVCMIHSKPHRVQNAGPWGPWLPGVENSRLFAQRAHSGAHVCLMTAHLPTHRSTFQAGV